MVTAEMVKELRVKTGAGIMDCKRALSEMNGDMEKAVEFLREKGLAAAAKKASRVAAEGLIDSYIHLGGKVGVLVEVNCETDFVARNPEFRELVHDIAMQVAAMSPLYVDKDEVSEDVIAKEKAILKAQALNEGKPEKMLDRIVEGKIDKYFKDNCLMLQPFIKDNDKTIKDLVVEKIARIGENIQIRRFVRFAIGEQTTDDK
ncbi:MAG: translation elongation factor Ts [bacterium]|jgi:elongation factor Ts